MKILLVSSSFFPKIDGSVRCVYDHGRKLVDEKHDIYLVTRGMPNVATSQTYDGMKVIRTSTSYRSASFLRKAGLILEEMLIILRLFRKKQFQIIHAHGFTAALAALPCKFFFRVPLLITTHGSELLWPSKTRWVGSWELRLTQLLDSLVLRGCDLIIAQSLGVKKYMLLLYGSAIEKRIVIVPTGIDEKKFSVPSKSSSEPRILFVGTLSEIKGVTCLLKAFASAHEKVPEAKLTLVGGGASADFYKRLAKELKIESSVDFIGVLRDDQRLLQLYRDSDILALPSTVGAPIPVTILEGMSCGKAVISTYTAGSIPDIVTDDVGILVKPNDVNQLASEIERLMKDRNLTQRLGRNARKAVVNYYTLDIMINKLVSLYTMFLNRRKSSVEVH